MTSIPVAVLRKHFWASKVKESSDLYSDIKYYFKNSYSLQHHINMRIKRATTLKRFKENNSDFKDPNVQLLWHGTQIGNVGGILTNGFKLPPRNGMFGRGIYFADRVSKSAQYCGGGGPGSKGVLFLCAVNLGKMYKATGGMNGLNAPPQGYDSVMGCGTNIPDPRDYRMHRGARIPCGKTTVKHGVGQVGLHHNEFIVYDLSKIAILFLIEFEYV